MADTLVFPWTTSDIEAEENRRRIEREATDLAASLRAFVPEAWPVVEPEHFIPGWHIDAILEHLEAITRGQIQQLIINVPPRHTKSTSVSVFWPAWEWASRPETQWLFSSTSSGVAIRDSVKCRRLLESKWYKDRWGKCFRMQGDQNEKIRYENDQRGVRIATTVESKSIGEGGGRIVVDDPNDPQERWSKAALDSVCDWWDTVMSLRRNSPKHDALVVIQQRVAERDLTGHLLSQGGWEVLRLPLEYEKKFSCSTSIGWEDPRTDEGEILCPERFDEAQVGTWKTQLGHSAAGMLQQRPAPLEGNLIKRAWWRFWREVPKRFDEVIQSWDMAFKDLVTSDFVAGHIWGRIGADKYLLDRIHDRMGFSDSCKALRNLTEKWPAAKGKLVEDKANGTAIMEHLHHEVSGLIAVEPQGGKVARVMACQPQIEAGNVYLPDPGMAGYGWVNEVIEEFALFPNAANDDDVDAGTQALIRLDRQATAASRDLAPIISETRPSPWHIAGENLRPERQNGPV